METINKKKFVLSGIFAGLLFASLMAVFFYFTQDTFSIWYFIFNFSFFGLLTGIPQYYAVKRANKKKQD